MAAVEMAVLVGGRSPVLSGWAAEVVCREAVWTNRTALLARLARCRRARVRRLAVTGLVRVGQVADARDHYPEWVEPGDRP